MRFLRYLLIATIAVVQSTTPFMYIMDYFEGICAILLRASYAYVQLASDQAMILSKSSSLHYPDLEEISVCDYLELPERIQCDTTHSNEELKNMSSALGCEKYTFKILHALGDQLNISGMTCVEGVLPIDNNFRFPWNYHQSIWQLFTELSAAMNLDPHTVAFHWRRGDQLSTRCRIGVDTSVNCSPVELFLRKVNATLLMLEDLGFSLGSVKVFIATNEGDDTVLRNFEELGYYHSGQLKGFLHTRNRTANSLELFLLDTMIMCYASWFNYYGISTVDAFVESCKHLRLFHGIRMNR